MENNTDLQEIKSMLNTHLPSIAAKIDNIQQDLFIIDKRLAAIEQRLSNIEKFVPVANANLFNLSV